MDFGRGDNRNYIRRLRNDPRTRAMRDGWVAQATSEADMRYPDPYDPRRTAFAAERALELALSFVLDNDGELVAVRQDLECMTKRCIDVLNTRVMPYVLVKAPEEPDAHS